VSGKHSKRKSHTPSSEQSRPKTANPRARRAITVTAKMTTTCAPVVHAHLSCRAVGEARCPETDEATAVSATRNLNVPRDRLRRMVTRHPRRGRRSGSLQEGDADSLRHASVCIRRINVN